MSRQSPSDISLSNNARAAMDLDEMEIFESSFEKDLFDGINISYPTRKVQFLARLKRSTNYGELKDSLNYFNKRATDDHLYISRIDISKISFYEKKKKYNADRVAAYKAANDIEYAANYSADLVVKNDYLSASKIDIDDDREDAIEKIFSTYHSATMDSSEVRGMDCKKADDVYKASYLEALNSILDCIN